MQHSVEKGLFIQGSQYSFESVHLHSVQYAFFYSYAKNKKEQEGEVAGSFEFPSSRGCCFSLPEGAGESNGKLKGLETFSGGGRQGPP